MRIFIAVYATIFILAVTGWIWNIVKLFNIGSFETLTGELILRIVGIPLGPLGVVMGYL